jgi:hypothetical protein
MYNYVGCQILLNKQTKQIVIMQPKLIKNMKETFADKIPNRTADIPAAHRYISSCPTDEDTILTDTQQSELHTGIGMLLYLIKHSHPDICIAVHELTKVLDRATMSHYKAMLRIMKYVLETEHHGLHIHPQHKDGIFNLCGKADSEFCGDCDTCISVYGYILYFCNVPIAWRSKSGKYVTLSSTEAEYFAISELAKEVLFVKQVLESMGITVEYPIIIHTDNVGAIYLSNNHTTSQRTRHIDTRYHFVCEYIEDNIIKVLFVRSEDNEADIFTKNTNSSLFHKHITHMIKPVDPNLFPHHPVKTTASLPSPPPSSSSQPKSK